MWDWGYQATVKELKESNQSLQKELQDEKSNHQMTQLRAEKQEEWNKRELSQLKDELADKKKLMDNMISKELYKRDLENLKIQNQTAIVRPPPTKTKHALSCRRPDDIHAARTALVCLEQTHNRQGGAK